MKGNRPVSLPSMCVCVCVNCQHLEIRSYLLCVSGGMFGMSDLSYVIQVCSCKMSFSKVEKGRRSYGQTFFLLPTLWQKCLLVTLMTRSLASSVAVGFVISWKQIELPLRYEKIETETSYYRRPSSLWDPDFSNLAKHENNILANAVINYSVFSTHTLSHTLSKTSPWSSGLTKAFMIL